MNQEGKMQQSNVEWLRERASAVRRGVLPSTEQEQQAFAEGLDMVADAYELIAAAKMPTEGNA